MCYVCGSAAHATMYVSAYMCVRICVCIYVLAYYYICVRVPRLCVRILVCIQASPRAADDIGAEGLYLCS